MKNIFAKNKFMKKLLCVIMFSVIIASSLTLFVSAGEKPAEYDEPIEWSLSGDGKKLTASTGKVYYSYELGIDAEMYPWSIYYFSETVRVNSGLVASVRSYDRYGEIVWLQTSGDPIIYATEVGKQILDGFVDGTGRAYRFELEDYYYSRIDASIAAELRSAYINGENRYTFDVRELRDYIRYDVQFEDSQEIFQYNEGYIFDIGSEYYYVHFDSLDNTHFDADGNFSFRSGEVELMKLEGEMGETVANALFGIRRNPRHRTNNFETDDNNSEMPMALFWIPYVLVGFVLPLPFLTLGLIFANVRKKSKHWYAVVISAGVWMLLAAILMIVLIM